MQFFMPQLGQMTRTAPWGGGGGARRQFRRRPLIMSAGDELFLLLVFEDFEALLLSSHGAKGV